MVDGFVFAFGLFLGACAGTYLTVLAVWAGDKAKGKDDDDDGDFN